MCHTQGQPVERTLFPSVLLADFDFLLDFLPEPEHSVIIVDIIFCLFAGKVAGFHVVLDDSIAGFLSGHFHHNHPLSGCHLGGSRSFFFKESESANQLGGIVEVEQRILAELGELCHKPLSYLFIAVGLNTGSSVSDELKFPLISFVVGQCGDELFHAITSQVLELITVELFPGSLGGTFSGRLVGSLGDLQIGEVALELNHQLVLIAGRIIHLVCEVGGDGQGLGNDIKLILFHVSCSCSLDG